MEKITVRKIRKPDLTEFKICYTSTIQEEFPEYSENIRRYFVNEYNDSVLKSYIKLGAYIQQKLVGYLLVGEKQYGGVICVDWLVVAKQYQKKGVGSLLLNTIEQIAFQLGAHTIHLEVSKKNIPFYTRCGYKEYGYDEGGYFGTDNYLMKKDIRDPNEEMFLK